MAPVSILCLSSNFLVLTWGLMNRLELDLEVHEWLDDE